MVEASQGTVLNNLEARIGEVKEGKIGRISWRNDDGYSLREERLIRTMGMQIDRAEETSLCGMGMDPPQGEEIVFDLIFKNLVFVRSGACIGSTGLFWDDQVSDPKQLLMGQVFACQNAACFNTPCSISMGIAHEFVEHITIHFNLSQFVIDNRSSRALIRHERESRARGRCSKR